jgi:hypothetical protein
MSFKVKRVGGPCRKTVFDNLFITACLPGAGLVGGLQQEAADGSFLEMACCN